METFRTFLDALRDAGELVDVHRAVDVRHVARAGGPGVHRAAVPPGSRAMTFPSSPGC